jgi:glycosyltransferase involved in cell wall biosynthesis
MRILQVTSCLSPGGAETLITKWAKYLHSSGQHRIDVCTIYFKGYLAEQLERSGIKVFNLKLSPSDDVYHIEHKYDVRVVLPLAKIIRNGNYDIVHAHLFPTGFFIALASLLVPKTKYIYSEHSVNNRRRQYRLSKVLDRFIYSRYNRVIAVSEAVRDELVGWLPELAWKTRVITNCIEPDDFLVSANQIQTLRYELGIGDDVKVILYIGRLQEIKGPDVLLKAIHLINSSEKPIRLLYAGSGPMKEKLVDQAAAYSLSDRITFLGLRTDVPILLHLADLVVIPSRWEGLPMVLLEAMAACRPVIATEVGGIPEVIENGVNGLLVPPDNPYSIAEKILLLLNSSEISENIGNNGLKRVRERYTTEIAVKKLLDVYNEVLI